MFDNIKEYEERLENRRKAYSPRNGAIHHEETYEERNRTTSIKPKKFWEC